MPVVGNNTINKGPAIPHELQAHTRLPRNPITNSHLINSQRVGRLSSAVRTPANDISSSADDLMAGVDTLGTIAGQGQLATDVGLMVTGGAASAAAGATALAGKGLNRLGTLNLTDTTAHAGNRISGALTSTAEYVDQKLGNTVGTTVGEKIAQAGSVVGKPVKGAAAIADRGIAGLKRSGIGNRLVNGSAYLTKPFKYLDETTLGQTRVGSAAASVIDYAMKPVRGFNKWIDQKTNYFSNQSSKRTGKALEHATAAKDLFAKELSHLSPELEAEVHGLLHTPNVHPEQFAKSWGEVAEKITPALKDNKAGSKAWSSITSLAEKSNKLHFKAQDALNIAHGTTNTKDFIKGMSIKQGISNGLWATSATASAISAAHSTISDLRAFRGLVADMKGISIDDVGSDSLLSELPYAARSARNALVATTGPKALVEAINSVFTVKMLRGAHVPMLAWLAPAAAHFGISMFTSGNILDTYKEMKANEAHGQANTPELYASLIGVAHKELAQRGGADSQFAKQLGIIYAERHASVSQTLQAINNGTIDMELAAIRQHNSQAQAVAPASVAHAPEHAAPSAELNHVHEVTANQATRQHASQHSPLVKHENHLARLNASQQIPMEASR